jgi:hypothetical protein
MEAHTRLSNLIAGGALSQRCEMMVRAHVDQETRTDRRCRRQCCARLVVDL